MNDALVSVLIVDDHELLRLGLRSVITSHQHQNLQVLEANSLTTALDVYALHAGQIALVLLDLNLPDSKGLLALQSFKRLYPQARIVVLSGIVDESIAQEAGVLGAESFLRKTGDLSAINTIVCNAIQAKRLSCSPVGAQHPGGPCLRASSTSHRLKMSPREVEILDMVLQGRSNQEIVEQTSLRIGTIKNYVSGMFIVFGVNSRAKLIHLFR